MCGICGVIFYGSENDLDAINRFYITKLFENLLINSKIRGTDATGMALVEKTNITVYKDKIAADLFINQLTTKELINKINAPTFRAFIGHTRQQTKGSWKFNVNNHPIVVDHIVGIHNGMIYNDDVLFKKYNFKRNGEVDSEIIFKLLAHKLDEGKSIVTSVKETMDELVGTVACAFVTGKNPRYLTLFKSNTQSIVLRIFKDIPILYFASSRDIIEKSSISSMGNNYEYFGMDNEVLRIDLLNSKGLIYTEKL